MLFGNNFLTVRESAKVLRVSERTIMRYIKIRRLRASKIGQWRILKNDLKRFVAAHQNN